MKVYHDHDENGAWTEITGIKSFPKIITRMNEVGVCTLTVVDFEGALYSTWKDYEFIPMKVEDDATNIIFRGYLTQKKFVHNGMDLTIKGIGIALEWVPFNKNYVLAEGLVKTVPYAGGDVPLTGNIVPDGDSDVNWDYFPAAGTHFQRVVDDSGDTFVQALDAHDGLVEEFTLATLTGVTQVTQCVVNFYGKYITNDITTTVELLGGSENLNFTNSDSWVAVTFAGLDKNQAELTAATLKLTAGIHAVNDIVKIYKINIDVTYTGDSDAVLELETDDEDNPLLGWTPDLWTDNNDVGLLITDNTQTLSTKTYTTVNVCVASNDSEGHAGNAASTQTLDGSYFAAADIGAPTDMEIEIHLDGDDIPTATNSIHHTTVVIHYMGTCAAGGPIRLDWKAKNENSGLWEIIKTHWITKDFGGIGLPVYFNEVTFNLEGVNPEYYLNTDGANYDSLEGFKVVCSGSGTINVSIDYAYATVYYDPNEISPIMEQIDQSGDEWVRIDGIDWTANGVQAGDAFQVGENTATVLTELNALFGSLSMDTQTTFSKYIARHFKGVYCMQALKSICLLEGLDWWEDYTNNGIVLSAEADYIDSTVDITEAEYSNNWSFHEAGDYYWKVEVFGNAAYNIYSEVHDNTIDSPRVLSIIDENIMSIADAETVAQAQFDIHSVKKPSIKLELNGIQSDLGIGKKVHITLARPTVGQAFYVIRRLERERFGAGIKTTIYAGKGQTPPEEKLANTINRIGAMAKKAHTDRLAHTPYSSGASLTWSDIGGAQSAVESIITAELVNGQSIDIAIDTLVATENTILEMNDVDLTGVGDEHILVYESDDSKWYDKSTAEYADILQADLQIGQAQVTDLDRYTQAEIGALKLNFWVAPDSNIAMGGNHLTGLDAGVNADDSVRKDQLHALVTVAAPLTVTGQLLNIENDAAAEITEFDTDVTMAGGATKVPTALAVKTFVEAKKLHEFVTPTSDIAMGTKHFTGLGDGTNAQDSATMANITTHAGDNDAHHALVTGTAPVTIVGQNISLLNDGAVTITEFDRDTTLAGGDTKVPTDLAVKTFVEAKKLSDFVAPTSDIAMGTKHFTGIGDGAAATDSVAYGQVSSAIGHDHQHNITVALLEDAVMYGSANSANIPCMYYIESGGADGIPDNFSHNGNDLRNIGAADTILMFGLPLPTVKNGLKLMITGFFVRQKDSDAGDYISTVEMKGRGASNATLKTYDASGDTTPRVISNTWVAVDCSSYDEITVNLVCVITNTNDLDIGSVRLTCYYTTV